MIDSLFQLNCHVFQSYLDTIIVSLSMMQKGDSSDKHDGRHCLRKVSSADEILRMDIQYRATHSVANQSLDRNIILPSIHRVGEAEGPDQTVLVQTSIFRQPGHLPCECLCLTL